MSRKPSSSSRIGSRFLPAICNSFKSIHPSAHATRMKVLPSLCTVPHASAWDADEKVAAKIFAVTAGVPSASRYSCVQAAG